MKIVFAAPGLFSKIWDSTVGKAIHKITGFKITGASTMSKSVAEELGIPYEICIEEFITGKSKGASKKKRLRNKEFITRVKSKNQTEKKKPLLDL